jgi:hypothetical protein
MFPKEKQRPICQRAMRKCAETPTKHIPGIVKDTAGMQLSYRATSIMQNGVWFQARADFRSPGKHSGDSTIVRLGQYQGVVWTTNKAQPRVEDVLLEIILIIQAVVANSFSCMCSISQATSIYAPDDHGIMMHAILVYLWLAALGAAHLLPPFHSKTITTTGKGGTTTTMTTKITATPTTYTTTSCTTFLGVVYPPNYSCTIQFYPWAHCTYLPTTISTTIAGTPTQYVTTVTTASDETTTYCYVNTVTTLIAT